MSLRASQSGEREIAILIEIYFILVYKLGKRTFMTTPRVKRNTSLSDAVSDRRPFVINKKYNSCFKINNLISDCGKY